MIYGCGKGRIHREQQTLHDPENPKVTRYGTKKPNTARPVHYKAVLIVDMETGESRRYETFKNAANAIGCSPTLIGDRMHGRSKGPIHGRYVVAKTSEEGE